MAAQPTIVKKDIEVDPAVAAAAAEDAEFESGFTGKPAGPEVTVGKEGAVPAVPGKPTAAAPTAPSQQQPTAGAAPVPGTEGKAGTPASATPPNPNHQNQVQPGDEIVQIDKKTLDRLLTAADVAATLKGTVDKLSGTIGSQEARIRALVNPSIEITEKDFEELAKDYPEIAAGTRRGLNAVLKKLGKQPQPGMTMEQLQAAVVQRTLQLEDEALTDAYPNWREIVGKPDEKTKFRLWLAKQPKAYQDRLAGTFSSQVLARAIQRFQVSEKPATPPTPPRKPAAPAQGARGTVRRAAVTDRLRSAVLPRGDGGANPSRQPGEDDEFAAGFKSG